MTKQAKPTLDKWEEELRLMINDWVVRLIRFGQTKLPEHGFYVFECPELEPFVSDLISQAKEEGRREVVNKIIEVAPDVVAPHDEMPFRKDYVDLDKLLRLLSPSQESEENV